MSDPLKPKLKPLLSVKDLPVIDRNHFQELLHIFVPVVEHPGGQWRARMLVMARDEPVKLAVVGAILDEHQFHQFHIAEIVEIPFRIPHVGDAAAHSGGEVATRRTEHHRAAARHILAAMVADTLGIEEDPDLLAPDESFDPTIETEAVTDTAAYSY